MPDILLSSHTAGRLRTASANAVAADIRSGKKAVVNGIPIVGTAEVKPLAVQNGILMYLETPIGKEDYRTYEPAVDHGSLLVAGPVGPISSNNWILTHQGWAYNDLTSYATFVQSNITPPAYTTRRKYEFWGAVQDMALTDAFGVRILFNYVDPNNYWQLDLRWSTGSAAFYMTFWEYTAAVGTTRATVTFSTLLDLPARWHLILYEQGDAIIGQCHMNELDSVADVFAYSIAYSVANRPNKNTGKFIFGTQGGIVSNQWLINGCRVMDLL